jgi:hypothetical protein
MKVPVLILLASVALLAFARAAPTWETMYVDSLSNSSVRAFAQNYTATAHLAGTEEDYQSALYTQAQVLPPFKNSLFKIKDRLAFHSFDYD